jgi:hypothetical protein
MNKVFHVLVREDGIKLACHLGCVLLYEVIKSDSIKVCVMYPRGTLLGISVLHHSVYQ